MHDPFIDNDRSNDPPVPLTADQLARGSVLSLLLTLATFGALLSFGFAVSGFINLKRATALNRELAEATAPVMKSLILAIALGGGQLGCAMGMWSWKKWGVVGYVAIGVVLFFLSARTDPQHHFSYGNLVWVAVVFGAAVLKWSKFQD